MTIKIMLIIGLVALLVILDFVLMDRGLSRHARNEERQDKLSPRQASGSEHREANY